MLLLAGGVTLTLVAWGVLLYAAVDFGQAAEKGQSSAWVFLAIAVIAASICLSLGLYLMVRIIRLLRGASAPVALLAPGDNSAEQSLADQSPAASTATSIGTPTTTSPVTDVMRDPSFVRPAEETPVEQTAERPALILDDESHEANPADLAEAAMLPRQRDHFDDDPTPDSTRPKPVADDPEENAISRLMRHEPLDGAHSVDGAHPVAPDEAPTDAHPEPIDEPIDESVDESGWVTRATETDAVVDPRDSTEAGPQRTLMDEIAARRAERAAAEERAAAHPVADHEDTGGGHHEATGRRAAAEPDEEPPQEPYIGRRVKR